MREGGGKGEKVGSEDGRRGGGSERSEGGDGGREEKRERREIGTDIREAFFG